MKIRSVVVLVISLTLLNFIACQPSNNDQKTVVGISELDKSLALYERAVALEDDNTAIVALNRALLEDSSRTDLQDSLARLYLSNSKYKPGLAIGKKLMALDPQNNGLLELMSFAQEVSGEPLEALAGFNTLYDRTKDGRYKYEVAKIEYATGDYTSSKKTLTEIIDGTEFTQQVEFLAQEGTQLVDIKAAAHFLQAQIAIDNNQTTTAMSHLRKSTAISPNFQSALYAIKQLQGFMAQQREARELQRLQQKYGGR